MTTQSISTDQVKQAVATKLASGEINRDQAKQILQSWTDKNAQPAQPLSLIEGTKKSVIEGVKDLPETALGIAETGATVATSAIAEPVAGFAGLGMAGLAKAVGADDPVGLAAKAVDATRDFLTYKPKSGYGQEGLEVLGKALTPLGKVIQKASEASGEVGYKAGPLAGAVAYAVPEALLEIFSVGASKASKVRKIKQQVQAGNVDAIMTPEVLALMENSGFSPAEIARIVEVDQAQIERLKRFNELDIQTTRGDITQKTADRKAEQQLAETAEGEVPNEMRQLRVQQSLQIENNLNRLIDRAVDDQVVGASIKDALLDRKKITESKYKQAYDALGEAQKGVDVPLLIDDYRTIPDLPDAGDIRDIKINKPSLYRTLEGALAEFGMNPDANIIEALATEGVSPQHVNLTNFERLRKRLGNIENMDDTGAMSRVIGPIRKEIDKQVEIATKTLENSSDIGIATLAKEARQNYRASKLEFDGKTLANDLTKKAPRSNQPSVHASEVYQKVVAGSTAIEKVDDLMQSLKAQGGKGKVAIGQLQSNIIMDILDSSLQGTSGKIDGTKVFSPSAFKNRLDKLNNNGKLKLIFQDNPRGYKSLMDNAEAMQDLAPGKLEIIKGSSSTMLDIVNSLGLAKVVTTIPFGSAAMEGLQGLSARSKNRKVFNRALESKPDVKEVVGILTTDYPSLAAALGVGYIATQTGEE
jgi:hypothetical protein